MKKKSFALLVMILALSTLFSTFVFTASSKGGVTVESSKSGVQSTSTAKPKAKINYSSRVKATDLADFLVSDFVDTKGNLLSKYDTKYDQKPAQLDRSNWYNTPSIAQVLDLTTSSYSQIYGDTLEEDVIDEEPMAESIDEAAPGSNVSVSHSTTTAQVEGVDEADIIKTDGKYIYYLARGNGVAIIKAGKNPKQVSSLTPGAKIGSGYPNYRDMYISGNKLVVTSTKYVQDLVDEYSNGKHKQPPNSYYSRDITSIYIYDISDPNKPILDREISFTGNLSTSRMYNNSIYIIANTYLSGNNNSSLLQALPFYKDTALGEDYYAVDFKNIFHSTFRRSYSSEYTTLVAFSLNDKVPISPQMYQGDYSNTIYMNSKSLYIANSVNINSLDMQVYKPQINKVGEVVDGANGIVEGMTFSMPSFPESYQSNSFSSINVFSISNNSFEFKKMGNVKGRVLNQYSMDEYKGYFRVATTYQDSKWRNLNAISVLNASTMKEVGIVDGLARNEEIKSVRFSGDTAYLVTFEQTDPLFVIDMKNPRKPKVLGELKIPGFSTFLKPYKDNILIGFGQEISETYIKLPNGKEEVTGSVNSGLKVSLFDVSNPQKPLEIDKLVIGGRSTHSEALSDPKAIMFDMDKGVMAFPVAHYGNQNSVSDQWNGGMVVEFNTKKLQEGAKMKLDTYYNDYGSRFAYIGNVLYYANTNGIVAMDYNNYKILDHIDIKF